MGSVSGQGPLDPRDPEYYAPSRLRERSGTRRSQGARLDSISRPISPPPPFDNPPNNAGSVSLRNPAYSEVLRQHVASARETDRRASLFRLAARLALGVGVVAVAALVFFLRAPASQQAESGSDAAEITAAVKVALPPPGPDEFVAKPALAQFKALLAETPASQPPATHAQSEQLQQFLQWREKEDPAETSH